MKKIPLYDVREIRDLKDMLRQSVQLYKDKPAFMIKPEKGGAYYNKSFETFGKDVDALGTALIDLIGQDSRVAILAESRYEWYVSYMSVVNGVGIVVPIDKELHHDEIASLLNRSRVNCVIYSSAKQDVLDQISDQISGVKYKICMDAGELSFADMLENGKKLLDEGDDRYLSVEINPDIMSILLFTSGTTAKSKAVMLSHKNICANLMDMCSMKYIAPEDIFLSVLPLHHTYECTCGFLCPVYRGATIAQCEGLRYITKNMQESKTTIMLVVPLMLEMFHRAIMKKAKADPKSTRKFMFAVSLSRFLGKLRIDVRKKLFHQVHDNFGGELSTLVCGGASINPQIMADMRDLGFCAIQGYGLTECAPILALNRDVDFNDAAAGLALPHCDVKVIDKDSDGIGEIIGKGPNIMLGYYEDEEGTADAIDQDQYYHTGDLGFIDQEGFVFITGRKKNVIIGKNGKNIFPEEIESLISELELVSEVLVSGVDDPTGDVVITAEIFPNQDIVESILGKNPDKKEITDLLEQEIKKINSRLVSYKAVRTVLYRDVEFEKTTSKKIKRNYSK